MGGKQSTGINVGGASILVIFILLCLTTFATLSMVSARADLRLSEKATAAVAEYYAADSKAEETLAAIDALLKECAAASESPEAYTSAVLGGLPGVVSSVTVERAQAGQINVLYAVPMGENQELVVGLRIPTASPGGSLRYVRTQWQVRNLGEWQPNAQGLDLWSGEEEMNLAGGLPAEPAP